MSLPNHWKSGQWYKCDQLQWVLQIHFWRCRGRWYKGEKRVWHELGFLENTASFASQTKGLKVSGSQTHIPRQLSDELSVKVSEAAGSHFPLNSREPKDEKCWGWRGCFAKAPPQLQWLQVLSPGTCGWAVRPGKGQIPREPTTVEDHPYCAFQGGSPGTLGEGRGGVWADVNYVLSPTPGWVTKERENEY